MEKGYKINQHKKLLFGVILLSSFLSVYPQEFEPYKLTLGQALEMGIQNHQQLKISQAVIETNEQQVKVAKSQQLPSVSFSANAFYLGDALLLDKDWSKVQTVEMPHFGNSFSLQASQLLYKGGVIRQSIEMAELQQQLAELDLVLNEQEIKFLIISNYLDIQKMINQLQVLEQNRILAEQLLANITKLYEEDMVTRNELIRSELQIKNIDQAIITIKNNHAIISNQMSYALGLPDNILIIPMEEVDTHAMRPLQMDYMNNSLQQHPSLLLAEKNAEVAEKNIAIQKNNWFPALSAFAGYNMQRPVTSTTPAMDLYNNAWQVGVNLSFNLDDLYKNKHRVSASRSQARIMQETLTYTQQNIEMGVNAAYLKYREAVQQVALVDESRTLANENYEIVRNKYLNQLAITAEMTDASNAKLNAELEYANAIINAMFQYYNLQKSTGTL